MHIKIRLILLGAGMIHLKKKKKEEDIPPEEERTSFLEKERAILL